MPRKGKTLKEVILEVASSPKTLDELIAEVKRRKPRTRPRVIKALVTKLVKAKELKKSGDKYVKA